jgi:predicted amidohydrolase
VLELTNQTVTLAAANTRQEHDKTVNMAKFIHYIEDAASQGVDYLAFPEIALQGYSWAYHDPEQMLKQKAYFEQEAEPIPGPATDHIQPYCTKYNLYVQFGLAEKTPEGIYNAAVLIGPEGIVGTHRKVYMQPNVFRRGDRFTVFDTRIGKVGMMICQDYAAPESTRTLALQGAQLIVNSTHSGLLGILSTGDYTGSTNRASVVSYNPDSGWSPQTDYKALKYDLCTRHSALVNQVWWLSADAWGLSSMEKALGLKGGAYGHSCVVTPWGAKIAEIGYEEGLLVATVNIQDGINQSRTIWLGSNYLDFPKTHGINYVNQLGLVSSMKSGTDQRDQ